MQLSSEDEAERQAAQEAIRAMGAKALPHLKWGVGNSHYRLEALKMLGAMDDVWTGKIRDDIIKTFKLKARESPLNPPEMVEAALEILARWGVEYDTPKAKVTRCYKCNKSSEQVSVRGCFLLSCNKVICEDHAIIVSGGMGQWYCCDAHRKEAQSNISNMM